MDYAVWQREWLQGGALEEQVDYWKQQLSGVSGKLELPTDRARPARSSQRGASHRFELPGELVENLHRLSRER